MRPTPSASDSAGIPPISWADTIVLAAKVSAELAWVKAKKTRLGAGADIDTISSAFGADFPLNLGRIDASEPDPAGRFPDPNTASVQEIQVMHCNFWLNSCAQAIEEAVLLLIGGISVVAAKEHLASRQDCLLQQRSSRDNC